MTKSSKEKDVFFVIGSLNVGGAETQLSILAPELSKRGYSVTIYNLSGAGPLGHGLTGKGVEVVDPPVRKTSVRVGLLKAAVLGLSAIKLFLLLLFRRPRIVHFFLPEAYVVGALTARAAGLSRLIMSRRSLNNYQRRRPVLARIEPRLHPMMSRILGNSRRVIEQLRDEENVPEDKLELIYNGIGLEPYETAFDKAKKRRAMDIGSGTLVLVTVANLIPYKGHADLLHGLSGVKSRLPRNWLLLIAGRDDGIGKDLEQLVVREGLDGHVRFLGVRNDVPDLLRLCDIGLLCSHEEGFSNVILEGMAAGLPMIVTDVGGNGEAVVDGETGIIVPPHAPSILGKTILRLANDRRLAKQMGRKGRQRVRQSFSLESCVSAYEAVYDAVSAGRTFSAGSGLRGASEVERVK